jgi:hypothetical protein
MKGYQHNQHAMRWVLATTLAASAVGAAAQTPSNPQGTPAAGKMTVIGCVERADQFTAGGTPAPVATTVDSQSFVLIKEEAAAPAASPAVGTSGTVKAGDSVAKTATTIGRLYRLDADVSTIRPHLGHKVEVVGTVDPASSAARPPDPANPSAATAPVLVVDSVKTIADLCPR